MLKRKKTISENLSAARGDCYEAAAKLMTDICMFGSCDLVLVHGEVMGQGPLDGITYGHAWVLDGNMVVDRSNGGNVILPQPVYYSVGKIDEINNTHTYTWSEARKKLVEFEHYGPWDLITETGL